ncbi:MAG TPA: hypothetical protein DD982_16690 [Thalassospira sp.]|nr:hypothetical protein [Thalassospira sp.]OHZ03269.1 hypothetical protein BC440_09795 [Thalassospira sp. MIT1004]HBS24162.1 hypothetical protein [Thalassospira sp.]
MNAARHENLRPAPFGGTRTVPELTTPELIRLARMPVRWPHIARRLLPGTNAYRSSQQQGNQYASPNFPKMYRDAR